MDRLGDPLKIQPIQTEWDISIKPYPSWPLDCIGNPDSQFRKRLVGTRIRTQSDSLVPLSPLLITILDQVSMSGFRYFCDSVTSRDYCPNTSDIVEQGQIVEYLGDGVALAVW